MEGTPHHQRHATFDAVKDMQSPRFRAIMKATSGRKKHPPIDVKSFSHELNSKSKQQNPFRKFHGYGYSQDIMVTMRVRFKRLKEEVNSELGAFAGDLVSLLEKSSEEYPDWSRTIEDMLVVAQECAEMSLDDFWNKCEGIVQTLDDRRQELPMGPLKQIHTRMLFILTRCTRLLQFQKESMLPGNEHALRLHQFSDLGVYPGPGGLKSIANMKHVRKHLAKAAPDHEDLLASRDRISSWKKLPPAGKKSMKKEQDPNRAVPTKEFLDPLEIPEKKGHPFENSENIKEAPDMAGMDKVVSPSQIRDQVIDGGSVMICRICDLKIPKMYVEQHSRICTLADRCDLKGLNVNERLERVAEILEKILEACSPKNSSSVRASQESRGVSTSSMADESNELSFESQTSTDAMEFASETNGSIAFNYKLATVPQMLCKTECVPPVDHCAVPTSSGSVSPPSSLSTPHGTQISLLLTGRDASSELENFQQVHELLDLAHCIANTNSISYASLDYLHSCLQELQEIVEDKKVDALIVETFGRRIEKLLQEKYAFVLRQIDDGKLDVSNVSVDEDGSTEGDSVHSSRTSPLSCKLKERTTIEDFEIIKPISRGAFGRVFLAKKRVTGDLFAIKILRKADMIRKNAVESILAERNILISVRNPFVVRFFYSFTCRENLYLVMEYLNGGDLYSLLRNLGCLDENMAQIYVAEVVLALEYLHSLNVIHRDLKPDNLLIGHDGHIKLTDFGLSKVGLINSTDDLSGPDVSGSALIGDQEHEMTKTERTKKREQRQKQEVVGTPDYLAPEILLGMTHGPTADWWSVGIILFELLVGIPPFNAEHPQKIFDNIMNRDIPWPQVPEEMSSEAYDLIDKLLIENPVQRLGATGAGEVKNHPFFKDINWDMLAKQKAAFIPSTDGDDDTSYFTCRHTWNSSDVNVCMSSSECDYFSDTCSMSCCSTPLSYDLDEEGDECKNLADFGGRTHEVNYSFSNFSFKNLSQLASINYDLIRKDTEDSRNTSNCQGS